MKKCVFILLLTVTFTACNIKHAIETNNKNNINSTDSITTQPVISYDATYPFGCSDLEKLKYPKQWDENVYGDETSYDSTILELQTLIECFSNLNEVPSISNDLVITKIEYLTVGNTPTYPTNDNPIYKQDLDSLKYRLPDFGKYNCYYYYQTASNTYGEFGYVLLYDKTTTTGTAINVYYNVAGDQHIKSRRFLMDENAIKLYEGYSYDDGTSLDKAFSISLNKGGDVIVHSL